MIVVVSDGAAVTCQRVRLRPGPARMELHSELCWFLPLGLQPQRHSVPPVTINSLITSSRLLTTWNGFSRIVPGSEPTAERRHFGLDSQEPGR